MPTNSDLYDDVYLAANALLARADELDAKVAEQAARIEELENEVGDVRNTILPALARARDMALEQADIEAKKRYCLETVTIPALEAENVRLKGICATRPEATNIPDSVLTMAATPDPNDRIHDPSFYRRS